MYKPLWAKPDRRGSVGMVFVGVDTEPHREISGTGVLLFRFCNRVPRAFCEVTRIVLKKIPSPEIRALFERVTSLGKASGYGLQDTPEIVTLFCSETNVIGLSMNRFAEDPVALIRAELLPRDPLFERGTNSRQEKSIP